MVDFTPWKAQPIKPLRMLGDIGAVLKAHWRGLAYIVAMPGVLSLIAMFIALVGAKVFGGGGAVLFWALFGALAVFVSIGISVSVLRLVLLGERPPRPLGFGWGRREARVLAHVLWLLVMWGLVFVALVVVEVIAVDHEKGDPLVLGAFGTILFSWLVTMGLNMKRLLTVPRIAIGLEDTRLRIALCRFVPCLGLPKRVRCMAKGHGWLLAGTWTLLSAAVLVAAVVAVALGGMFGAALSSKLLGLLIFYFAWYAALAVLSLGAALLYLRLGGEVADDAPPPSALEDDGETV